MPLSFSSPASLGERRRVSRGARLVMRKEKEGEKEEKEMENCFTRSKSNKGGLNGIRYV